MLELADRQKKAEKERAGKEKWKLNSGQCRHWLRPLTDSISGSRRRSSRRLRSAPSSAASFCPSVVLLAALRGASTGPRPADGQVMRGGVFEACLPLGGQPRIYFGMEAVEFGGCPKRCIMLRAEGNGDFGFQASGAGGQDKVCSRRRMSGSSSCIVIWVWASNAPNGSSISRMRGE